MRAVELSGPGSDFELVEREVPQPGHWEVLVRTAACGVCHSDAMAAGGMASAYPRVPGHEVAGTVEAVGDGVTQWQVGQRVGIGWFGGACYRCTPCREGDFISCVEGRVTGLTADGGYAEHVLAPADALAAIPDELTDAEAAPLMCAGVTCFHALRESGARAGDLVAVVGLGGLGHLGVQFAAKMGFEVVAIARGPEKGEFATQLGAHHYVDSTASTIGRTPVSAANRSVSSESLAVPDAWPATRRLAPIRSSADTCRGSVGRPCTTSRPRGRRPPTVAVMAAG